MNNKLIRGLKFGKKFHLNRCNHSSHDKMLRFNSQLALVIIIVVRISRVQHITLPSRHGTKRRCRIKALLHVLWLFNSYSPVKFNNSSPANVLFLGFLAFQLIMKSHKQLIYLNFVIFMTVLVSIKNIIQTKLEINPARNRQIFHCIISVN